MKGDVFAQPDKPFILDTATFILADEDIRRVANVDEVPWRDRMNVSEQTDGEVDITIGSILRIVPGTRLVGICKWKDKTAVVKIFYRPGHWRRSLFRDLQGANLLEQSNIPSPDIIHKTFLADKKGGVLLFDYLESGESLAFLIVLLILTVRRLQD